VRIKQLLLDDHYGQRGLFAILEQVDQADTDVLSASWTGWRHSLSCTRR
jgi:hypothetical protein